MRKKTKLELRTLMQDYYGRRGLKQPARNLAITKIFWKLAAMIGGQSAEARKTVDKDIRKAWDALDRQRARYIKHLEEKNKAA